MKFSALQDGAFDERFAEAFQEVIDDIADPNKLVADKRTLTIKLDIVPTGRDGAHVVLASLGAKMGKIAEPLVAPIQISIHGGLATAHGKNSEADGHRALFDRSGDVSADLETTDTH